MGELLQIVDFANQLEDLSTLFSDKPVGVPEDFDIDADPDDDLVDPSDIEVTQELSIADLEALTVWYILRDQFGEDWWQLEAQALSDALSDDFSLAEADLDLFQALRVLESGNGFWKEWEVFNWVCQGLSGIGTNFTAFPVLTIEQMAEAMVVAELLLRTRKRDESYSEEVLSYISITCLEQGLWVLPFPLDVAQNRTITLLRRRDMGLPLERLDSIKAGEQPLDDVERVQGRRFKDLKGEINRMVQESVRELSTYRRLDTNE